MKVWSQFVEKLQEKKSIYSANKCEMSSVSNRKCEETEPQQHYIRGSVLLFSLLLVVLSNVPNTVFNF